MAQNFRSGADRNNSNQTNRRVVAPQKILTVLALRHLLAPPLEPS
jgi:hypothetical protein